MPVHLALAAALAAAFVPSFANSPSAGDFDALRLAFDGPRVTGAFSEERGAGPFFSCKFLVTGTWRAGGWDVLTWWPGETDPDTRIRGRLTVDAPQTTATLKLVDEPGGCGMVGEDFVHGAGYEGLRGGKQPWIAVREVRSARAAMHAAPDGPPHGGYIVRGDRVEVRRTRPGWVDADYTDRRGVTRGWIAESDLQPSAP